MNNSEQKQNELGQPDLHKANVMGSAFTDEDKNHYEALLECCNKLLDSVDAGKLPKRQIMGLRILLNRPHCP